MVAENLQRMTYKEKTTTNTIVGFLQWKGDFMKSNKIKELREMLILDQKQFGDLFGVSRTTISDWENEKSKPNFTNMRKLKDMYNNIFLQGQDNQLKEKNYESNEN